MKITAKQIQQVEPVSLHTAEWIETIANKAIEIALAEQAAQEQSITAKEAEALGEGNAEYHATGWASWHICGEGCNYFDGYQYRAIRKEVPAEPHTELKQNMEIRLADEAKTAWDKLYPIEPTCQVHNNDTGELKTMTREKAKLLQGELGNTVEWSNDQSALITPDYLIFNAGGIYAYKRKALKPVSLADMPVGVMTDKGELRKVIYSRHVEGAKMQIETNQNASTANVSEFYSPKDLTLAPADQQPWLNWRGGDCPVPEGVMVEVLK